MRVVKLDFKYTQRAALLCCVRMYFNNHFQFWSKNKHCCFVKKKLAKIFFWKTCQKHTQYVFVIYLLNKNKGLYQILKWINVMYSNNINTLCTTIVKERRRKITNNFHQWWLCSKNGKGSGTTLHKNDYLKSENQLYLTNAIANELPLSN